MNAVTKAMVVDAGPDAPTRRVERAFLDACLLDVLALKPGNVGVHGAGHGAWCWERLIPTSYARTASLIV